MSVSGTHPHGVRNLWDAATVIALPQQVVTV